MTSSTSETEEQEIYRVISDALLCLCEQKPNDPVDFLSRKMLELIGDDHSTAIRKKEITENDIEKLQLITNLTKQHGVNLAGVEIIINMQEQISALNEKINQIETNIKIKHGEDISIIPKEKNTVRTIKIEKE